MDLMKKFENKMIYSRLVQNDSICHVVIDEEFYFLTLTTEYESVKANKKISLLNLLRSASLLLPSFSKEVKVRLLIDTPCMKHRIS